MFSIGGTSKNKNNNKINKRVFKNRHTFCSLYSFCGRIDTWSYNSQPHRTDGGPATICYDITTGSVISMLWCKRGKKHNTAGPALITYYNSGIKERELWYENDYLHRLDGFAATTYHKNGNIYTRERIHYGKYLKNK